MRALRCGGGAFGGQEKTLELSLHGIVGSRTQVNEKTDGIVITMERRSSTDSSRQSLQGSG